MINVLRNIFISIDTIVYGILEQIFLLIYNLSRFELFSNDTMKKFATRIYLILGLVMVFKLMISFIQILIDPDKMNDKEKGVGNILKRVVISVVLITLVPGIFSTAKRLQNYIVVLIPRIVVASKVNVSDENIDYDASSFNSNKDNGYGEILINSGRLMSYYSFLPFFYYADEECNNGHLLGTNPEGTQPTITSVADAVKEVNDKNCPQAKDGYTYNYRMFVSTVVGVYLVYVLVTVALKIAIRAIKFSICELIAPIPIASYIDPGTSKKAFDNWVNTSVKVYLDLFVRLITVYFIVFVFKELFDNDGIKRMLGQFNEYGWWQGFLVALFIIVGLLNFAKEMPKFITGMLGISDSFSDIGDMFKGQGWKALGGMAGTGLASLRAAKTNYRNSQDANEHVGTSLRRAIGGLAGAQKRGLAAVAAGKGFKESYTDNFNTTTAISARKVAKRATIKQSKEEREKALQALEDKRNRSITEAKNNYASQYGKYDGKSKDEIMGMYYDEELAEAESARIQASKERVTAFNSLNAAKRNESMISRNLADATARGDTAAISRLTASLNEAKKRRIEAEKNLTRADKKFKDVNDSYTNLKNGGIDIDAYERRYNEYLNAQASRDSIIDKAQREYESGVRLVPTEISPIRTSILDQVLGRQTVTSESYSKAASTMTSTKSEALGEARAKLVESGQNLKVNVGGQEYTYGEFLRAKSSIKPGDTTVDFRGTKIDINAFNSMYETATKAADVAFVNEVAAGHIENAKIEKILKNYDDFLHTLNLDDKAIVDELTTLFKTNPGLAIKKAGDYAEGMQRKAAQMSTVEQINRQQQQEKKS